MKRLLLLSVLVLPMQPVTCKADVTADDAAEILMGMQAAWLACDADATAAMTDLDARGCEVDYLWTLNANWLMQPYRTAFTGPRDQAESQLMYAVVDSGGMQGRKQELWNIMMSAVTHFNEGHYLWVLNDETLFVAKMMQFNAAKNSMAQHLSDCSSDIQAALNVWHMFFP